MPVNNRIELYSSLLHLQEKAPFLLHNYVFNPPATEFLEKTFNYQKTVEDMDTVLLIIFQKAVCDR